MQRYNNKFQQQNPTEIQSLGNLTQQHPYFDKTNQNPLQFQLQRPKSKKRLQPQYSIDTKTQQKQDTNIQIQQRFNNQRPSSNRLVPQNQQISDNISYKSKKSRKSNRSIKKTNPLQTFVVGKGKQLKRENSLGSNKSFRSKKSNYSTRSNAKKYTENQLAQIDDIEELKQIVYQKQRERKHLEEKLVFMKEAQKDDLFQANDPNLDKLHEHNIKKLEKEINLQQKQNQHLEKEVNRLKKIIQERKLKFDAEVYQMKFDFEQQSRKLMQNYERDFVFKNANRENSQIQNLIKEIEILERQKNQFKFQIQIYQ